MDNGAKIEILSIHLGIEDENYDEFLDTLLIGEQNDFEYNEEVYYIYSRDELDKIELDFINVDINEILYRIKELVPDAYDYFNKDKYISDYEGSYEAEFLVGKTLAYDDEDYFIFED